MFNIEDFICFGRPKIIREHKGKSLFEIVNSYTIIDIETTGLDPAYDEIIEIGAIKVVDGLIINKFQSLIKPIDEIPEFITKLTGITNEMVVNAPRTTDIMPAFLEFIKDDILVGHNVNFDINFLYDFSDERLTNDFIDTMRLSRFFFKEFENHKLATLIKMFNINITTSHRSIADCESTYHCFEHIKKHIIDNNIDLIEIKKRKRSYFKASEVVAASNSFDENNIFFNKTCVFTGTLEKMTRKDAMQLVVDLGAICGDNVTKQTNYLILGNNDYCKLIKDGKSNKQKKAEDLILKGLDIQIITENVFYDMLDTVKGENND